MKLISCAGCRKQINPRQAVITCHFAQTSFTTESGYYAKACGTRYHPECIMAGEPFSTRRNKGLGLSFPKHAHNLCAFICEYCTVRAITKRELHHHGDTWLLRLERVRLLDLIHSWSDRSGKSYQGKVGELRAFEQAHPGVSILPRITLERPPSGSVIPAMWTELDKSVTVLPAKGPYPERYPAYGTIRAIRSGLAQQQAWHLMVTKPENISFEGKRLVLGEFRSTDTGLYTQFSKGLRYRIGENPNQATALLRRHVMGINEWIHDKFLDAPDPTQKRQLALAGLANTFFWLGWLRGSECFGLHGQDVDYTRPEHSHLREIPRGWGAIQLTLGPETKSNRAKCADVVMTATSGGGLSPGYWLDELEHWGGLPKHLPVFRTPEGTIWTSQHYRNQYVYPALWHLRSQGDAALIGKSEQDIHSLYYSLHSYRRGARTDCQRQRKGTNLKPATASQVYEHGRWNKSRSSEAIDVVYTEWTLEDRLMLTAYSM